MQTVTWLAGYRSYRFKMIIIVLYKVSMQSCDMTVIKFNVHFIYFIIQSNSTLCLMMFSFSRATHVFTLLVTCGPLLIQLLTLVRGQMESETNENSFIRFLVRTNVNNGIIRGITIIWIEADSQHGSFTLLRWKYERDTRPVSECLCVQMCPIANTVCVWLGYMY